MDLGQTLILSSLIILLNLLLSITVVEEIVHRIGEEDQCGDEIEHVPYPY